MGLNPSRLPTSYGRTVGDRPLPAAVAIFEAHDVIELSGARLENDRVLQGCHPVSSTRAEMDCLAGEQLE